MLVRVPISSLPPGPLLLNSTGPPLTLLKAGSSTSPPLTASTSVREPRLVVSAVIVFSAGSETKLPVLEASTTTSAPPIVARSLAVRVPPPSASSVVSLSCAAGPTIVVRVPMSSFPSLPLLLNRTGPPLTSLKAGSTTSPPLDDATSVK